MTGRPNPRPGGFRQGCNISDLAHASIVSELKCALEASEARARRAEKLLGESEALVTSFVLRMEQASKKQRLVEEQLQAVLAAAAPALHRGSRADDESRAERAERLLQEAEAMLTSLMVRAELAESRQKEAERRAETSAAADAGETEALRTSLMLRAERAESRKRSAEHCAEMPGAPDAGAVEVDEWLADGDAELLDEPLTTELLDSDTRALTSSKRMRIIRVETPAGEPEASQPAMKLIILPPARKGAFATLLMVPSDKSI